METGFLLKGLFIGFLIAAPVGPIGVLCIQRTLARGRLSGLISGLGAASADAVYGSVAGFGLTLIAEFLIDQHVWFSTLGGLFLCYLGFRIFRGKPAEKAVAPGSFGLFTDYASTFLLTLTNPMTILSFAAVFAGLGLVGTGGDYLAAGLLILGVFTGSALWWTILAGGVGMLKDQLSPERFQWLNRVSGVLITGFGVFTLLHAL
ncbi:MAG: LysE family translocator [Desulforudis sp.]|jgi:threonine/homoserine/homoserine lactone efflux protein|nr:LysE family transporter [Clostridia bacterium]RJX19946.1 MAG: LysE family translocator [Desulforudis sp.]